MFGTANYWSIASDDTVQRSRDTIAMLLFTIILMHPVVLMGQSALPHLWVTINARDRRLSVTWVNATLYWCQDVVVSNREASTFTSRVINGDTIWVPNNGLVTYQNSLMDEYGSVTTQLVFNYELSRKVNASTACYKYWAHIIENDGMIVIKTCTRAYPRWMNELKPKIGHLRLRDIVIPGTHDSGSYLKPTNIQEFTRYATKYDWTQDDDVRGQLMHGARYIEMSVGYYRNKKEVYYVTRGLARQRSLASVMQQVKDFVLETKEVVIVNFHNFTVGFNDIRIYRSLAHYLREHFDKLIVMPPLSFNSTLNDIWRREQYVILVCSDSAMQRVAGGIFLGSIQRMWGNAKEVGELKTFLRSMLQYDEKRKIPVPVAYMAIMQPDKRAVLTDKHGGFRVMTDNANRMISELLYELGPHVNILVVDFIRSSNLAEVAIEFNFIRHRTLS